RHYMQDPNVIRATKNLIVVPYENGITDIYTGWAVYAEGGDGLTLRGATDIFFVRGKESPSIASIQGRVLAPGGIRVELVNAGLQTTTDESGTYKFFNLPPGNYTVLVRAPGLPIEQRTNVVFQGQPVTVGDIYLTPAPKGIKGAVLIGELWISTD